MSSSPATEDGDIGFQIAPMVDVVFVLMLFFMACAGWQMKERELNANLAGKGKSTEAVIVIEIADDGRVLLNDQPLGETGDRQLAGLRAWFKDARARFGTDDPVVIRPAATTRQERIIDVLNATTAAGVAKVSFL